MLAQLTISNFAIVRELEIDFQNGMTVITGETGAGKSIAIDALVFVPGRTRRRRHGTCRRHASRPLRAIRLKRHPRGSALAGRNQLEEGRECLLRRVISSDGRSPRLH